MDNAAIAPNPPPRGAQFRLALRLALREMRGGLGGFYIFLACIALGTAAIAGVNSVSRSITEAIAAEGQAILAADMRFEIDNRPAGEEDIAYLESLGEVARSVNLRSMARLPDGSDQSLVEVKAVDDLYPLYGELVTAPRMDFAARHGLSEGAYGAVVAPILLDRLGLSLGDRIDLGNATFEIRATLENEPDLLSESFAFAPRFLISLDGIEAAGLVQLGSLVEHVYKVRLFEPATYDELQAMRDVAREDYRDAGWAVRTSAHASPQLTENVERFSQFLTLVGLTALIVGGVGVANAVRAFMDSKRSVIATFKCLGAAGRFVVLIYLIQIALIASIGIAAGLAIGLVVPFVAQAFLVDVLPISADVSIYPGALIMAAVFGMLTAFAFAILPLGRARDVPATALFRSQGFDAAGWPRPVYVLGAAGLIVILALLAVMTAHDRLIAAIFIAAVAFAFVILRLVGYLIQSLARRAPQVRSPALRLAIGNIHRPGALTPSVVLSLGLGLALLVTLALIDGNLRREIAGNLPERAPNFFFVDIQSNEIDGFRDIISQAAPQGQIDAVPMLRGRITQINGVVPELEGLPPGGRWVLRGDRGLTYAADMPENARLTDGEWWAPGYDGEPLVSFSAEEAGELGIGVGDTITVSVLGREVTARIANLRDIEWESMSINFVMVFSPNTFAGAPHAWLATLTDPGLDRAGEAEVLRGVTSSYPTITSVRVKDAIDVVNRLLEQLTTAIRAAASVALVASVLVLAGALAAGNRARRHDAVVLKTLGATRTTLIRAFSYEYLMLGLATGLFALLAGGVAAWFVIARIMTLPSTFLPDVALVTLAIALVVTVGIGLAGTWRVLGQKAAPILRNL
ncbi:ABC transporter permease [Pararhizobium haloflavum]|uniref:ABC transporter permease n=1 Tax=Pararhizobium haloflavum TaxID=2037914 RepID=UPI000C17980F|nr:ABC transporter permease [Pararhizobium haloflavum]